MITLSIDASTYVGDVAVIDGTRLVAEESVAMKGADVERLMPAVEAVLARANVRVDALARVVCGAGPGSFTSLRIAGSIAKGIATGVRCPLYAAPSLALIVGGARPAPGLYLAATDALRSEFYVGLYASESNGTVAEVEAPRLVAADQVENLATEFGAKIVSPSPFANGLVAIPKARAVLVLEQLLASRGPVDVATWEPSYGRLAEAQVRWEAANRQPLPAA